MSKMAKNSKIIKNSVRGRNGLYTIEIENDEDSKKSTPLNLLKIINQQSPISIKESLPDNPFKDK